MRLIFFAGFLLEKTVDGGLVYFWYKYNNKMKSHNATVKNFFERLKGLLGTMFQKYHCVHSSFDRLFGLCFALTDVYVLWHRLRDEDASTVRRSQMFLSYIGDYVKSKRI